VIENFQSLRDQLINEGHQFRTETDTEVLAHLIGRIFDSKKGEKSKRDLLEALREALNK